MSSMQPQTPAATPATTATPASMLAAQSRKKPIELRQTKVLLPSGALTLRIDMCVSNSSHSYAIGIYPGFTGGGREPDGGLAVRVHAPEFTPKYTNCHGQIAEAWPPLAALERRVDGEVWTDTHLPEGNVPQRLEKAMAMVEPMLRQLVNQRQLHLVQGKVGHVADQPLIARIKTILSGF